MSEDTTWFEERRLELVVDKALEDAKFRSQSLTGRDKEAVQMEWLEFASQEWNDLDVLWLKHFQDWGK